MRREQPRAGKKFAVQWVKDGNYLYYSEAYPNYKPWLGQSAAKRWDKRSDAEYALKNLEVNLRDALKGHHTIGVVEIDESISEGSVNTYGQSGIKRLVSLVQDFKMYTKLNASNPAKGHKKYIKFVNKEFWKELKKTRGFGTAILDRNLGLAVYDLSDPKKFVNSLLEEKSTTMDINEELLDNLMDAISSGSPSDFAEAFDTAMKAKCADAIDERREEIAESIHEEEEYDDDDDDSEEVNEEEEDDDDSEEVNEEEEEDDDEEAVEEAAKRGSVTLKGKVDWSKGRPAGGKPEKKEDDGKHKGVKRGPSIKAKVDWSKGRPAG